MQSHKADSIFETVSQYLEENGVDLLDCRGMGSDNASNMSGKYAGFQAHLKNTNKNCHFVPCAGHSLNLVGSSAVDCCKEAINFFGVLQKLYNFFTSSPRRQALLMKHLKDSADIKNVFKLASQSQTRWCAHFTAVRAVKLQYTDIIYALKDISENEEEKKETRQEALSLRTHLEKYETVFLAVLWYKILNRMDKVSKTLQDPELDLITGTNLLESLIVFMKKEREEFISYEEEADEMIAKLKDRGLEVKEKDVRARKPKYADGSVGSLETQLHGREKIKVDIFFVIFDKLVAELTKRLGAYKDVEKYFRFVWEALSSDTVHEASFKKFIEFYAPFFDDSCFLPEIKQFYKFIKLAGHELKTSQGVFKAFSDNPEWRSNFPNVQIAYQLFLILPVTSCEAERAFSKLTIIKNKLRSTMSHGKLKSLALLSIESDLTRQISFENLINEFATRKARKTFN